ncbi:hypothetical protein PUN28_005288 [Cardiocondyla obscurior]|uniref:Uncharacterized protein n=1 Tax=Cardiocondyla obscurior TaxID=286306 RepID=A0AAW2GJN7_9HYME
MIKSCRSTNRRSLRLRRDGFFLSQLGCFLSIGCATACRFRVLFQRLYKYKNIQIDHPIKYNCRQLIDR